MTRYLPITRVLRHDLEPARVAQELRGISETLRFTGSAGEARSAQAATPVVFERPASVSV